VITRAFWRFTNRRDEGAQAVAQMSGAAPPAVMDSRSEAA
jgi:hypothetical protein